MQITLDLGTLVAGITPENLHTAVNFDSAVGKEAFSAPKRRGVLTGVTFNTKASDTLEAEIAELFEGKVNTV